MKTLTFILLVFSAFFQSLISPNDLKILIGEWKGELMYMDYGSGKPIKIPADMSIAGIVNDRNAIELYYKYPKEPQENGKDTLRISSDGKMVSDKRLVSREKQADGSFLIKAEKEGTDNDKAATFTYFYLIGAKKFTIRKYVQYKGEQRSFLRNEYNFSR